MRMCAKIPVIRCSLKQCGVVGHYTVIIIAALTTLLELVTRPSFYQNYQIQLKKIT